MKYLLDSNTCIRYLNGRSPQLRAKFLTVSDQDIALCSVVKAEMFAGSQKSQFPQRSLATQMTFFNRFISLPFDDNAATEYGRLRAFLETRGTPISANDMLIAAIALAHDLVLVTHNINEFGRVPDLIIEDWETT
jgi:tRNA(fMet)-specific endonuclease VapC